jgi:hypothetical protein
MTLHKQSSRAFDGHISGGGRSAGSRIPRTASSQTKNLGTYDDILVLEQTVGKYRLVETHATGRTGLDQRPLLGIWRGRLSFATAAAIPDKAPRRSLHATAP